MGNERNEELAFWFEGEYEGMTGKSIIVLVMLRTKCEEKPKVRVQILCTDKSPLVSLLREKRKCLIKLKKVDFDRILKGETLLQKEEDDIYLSEKRNDE
jgi:hypothetical protein